MDIHKPKPWHGLREFLKEYAIIFVGVLTALAAEQVVENFHWTERTGEARQQLADELGTDASAGLAWLSLAPCFNRQLVGLEAQLWAARSSGVFAGHSPGYAPPLFVFTSDAWLNARSLQISDHLSPKEVRTFTQAYFFPPELSGDVTRLHEEAAELAPLSRPLPHITAAEADEFLGKIGRVKELEARMDLGMMLMIRDSERLGAPVSAKVAAGLAEPYRRYYRACISDPAQVLSVLRQAHKSDLDGGGDLYLRLQLSPPALPE
jgi:hypothetical protein